MRIRVLCVLGLISLQVGGFLHSSWAMTVPELSGSPRPDSKYTLFVELNWPYESNRVALRKMLRNEGYESFSEGEREFSLVLTAEQIGMLFQTRVRFRKVEASASPGTVMQPFLELVRIPDRFGKLIRRVYFDPQRE